MELNFSTFTVSKDVYKRFFDFQKKYMENNFAGKRRLFNEFVIKNGCDTLLKQKGSVYKYKSTEKVHLKLWFYDFIVEILNKTRDKLMKSGSLSATRINNKKILINDLIIGAGCDKVLEFVKKTS
jgi:hypothetical protein